MIELLIVLTVFALIAVFAVPQVLSSLRAFRTNSDARSIASQLALTKMRAANGFTQARLNCNTSAASCQLEVCTSKSGSACNSFSAEGGPVNLSTGVSFGFGSITSPAGTQSTIHNTAQILFNSRSLPVDTSGAATGDYGLYLTDQYNSHYAVTVYATGRVAVWQYSNGAWTSQ